MHSDLAQLMDLQQVENEIARLAAEVAALPKHLHAIEAKLNSAKDRVEKAKAAIKADEMAKRKYESEIQGQHEKIRKFREQSSSVKTNDQYRALMNEISFAEQEIRSLEDKILDCMEDAENKERQVKTAETELKAEAAEIEREKAEARALTEKDEKRLSELRVQQSSIRAAVGEDSLRQYDRVSRHRGTGIAEARDQRCLGCQIMLRPQVFAEVRKGERVITCDSCSRLLYYIPSEEPETAFRSNVTVERTWMFLPHVGERGVFAVFVNNKGNASMRTFDIETGRFLEKHSEKGKTYTQAFGHQMEHGRELFVDEAGLEDEKEQLPPEALQDLRRQIPHSQSSPAAE
ncbi:MAG: C4-type zinc ribbon domain-containing protein [Terriglobia bacterium]|jgi:predicted  nucleic acid-binding Zn-ribbon protein|nr:C4-type zinc ribbon domain-containing protein [Terriglobia bacterium]